MLTNAKLLFVSISMFCSVDTFRFFERDPLIQTTDVRRTQKLVFRFGHALGYGGYYGYKN